MSPTPIKTKNALKSPTEYAQVRLSLKRHNWGLKGWPLMVEMFMTMHKHKMYKSNPWIPACLSRSLNQTWKVSSICRILDPNANDKATDSLESVHLYLEFLQLFPRHDCTSELMALSTRPGSTRQPQRTQMLTELLAFPILILISGLPINTETSLVPPGDLAECFTGSNYLINELQISAISNFQFTFLCYENR